MVAVQPGDVEEAEESQVDEVAEEEVIGLTIFILIRWPRRRVKDR